MERAVTGFHRDDAGDWVAELACGHDQHVRHRPPLFPRPWVLEEDARAAHVGTPLPCPLCDRAELPAHLRPVRTSPVWDEHTLPAGLRRAHRLGPGTWGRIVLRAGRLRFTMTADAPWQVELAGPGATQAIPPETAHAVEPLGPVRFSIEFLAVDRDAPATAGDARPPAADEGGDPPCFADAVCPECGTVLDGSPHRPGCTAGRP